MRAEIVLESAAGFPCLCPRDGRQGAGARAV